MNCESFAMQNHSCEAPHLLKWVQEHEPSKYGKIKKAMFSALVHEKTLLNVDDPDGMIEMPLTVYGLASRNQRKSGFWMGQSFITKDG